MKTDPLRHCEVRSNLYKNKSMLTLYSIEIASYLAMTLLELEVKFFINFGCALLLLVVLGTIQHYTHPIFRSIKIYTLFNT
jgi:hypothetical protein